MKLKFGRRKRSKKHNNNSTITVKEQKVPTTASSTNPTKKLQKKKKRSIDFDFSYSIIPTNFINLSEEAQIQRMGQFFDILNVID
ncbi:MAG: hypothetical protein ACR2LL_00145, partial [Nitrosopumilus sp.]